MTTLATGLAGRVEPINLDHGAPIPSRLVFELAHELAPADVGNRFGKGGMLHHILDRQTLDDDRLVLANEVSRKLMLVVPSSIDNVGVDFRHTPPLLLAVLAPLLFACKSSLGSRQLFCLACSVSG